MIIPLLISFVVNKYAVSKSNEKMISILEKTINNDIEEISQSLTRIETNHIKPTNNGTNGQISFSCN